MVFMKGVNAEIGEGREQNAFMKGMNAEIGEGREQSGVHKRG
ncbi:hypothetical protein MHH96_21400 [Niallia sp. FSL K6-0212]